MVAARARRATFVLGLVMGRLEEALEELRLARRADPYSALAAGYEANLLATSGRVDEAVESALSGIELDAEGLVSYVALTTAYLAGHRPLEAVVTALSALNRFGPAPFILVSAVSALAARGRHAEAQELHDELSERAAEQYVQGGLT